MKKNNQTKWQVYSPDGFPIIRDKVFNSFQEANDALQEWVKRYKLQGYYSMADRTCLTLEELPSFCKIIKL
jgi:hypothetical protein